MTLVKHKRVLVVPSSRMVPATSLAVFKGAVGKKVPATRAVMNLEDMIVRQLVGCEVAVEVCLYSF